MSAPPDAENRVVCEKKNSRRQRANEIILYAFERIEFLYEKIGFDRFVVILLVTRLWGPLGYRENEIAIKFLAYLENLKVVPTPTLPHTGRHS